MISLVVRPVPSLDIQIYIRNNFQTGILKEEECTAKQILCIINKDVLNVLERKRVALPMSGFLKNGIAEKNFTESGGCRSGCSPSTSTYCFIHQEYKLSRCETNPELFFSTRRLMRSCSRPALRSTSRLRWRRRE